MQPPLSSKRAKSSILYPPLSRPSEIAFFVLQQLYFSHLTRGGRLTKSAPSFPFFPLISTFISALIFLSVLPVSYLFPRLRSSPFSSMDTRGESGPVGNHRHVFIPYFDLPIPRFPARLIPVSPPFPSFPASISCLPKNSPKNLVRFPKNLSVIPEKWLIYWLPKNLPFSQKLDIFPKNFPRFYFFGSFQGETRGIGGVVAAVPSVLSKQCLSSLLVSF